MSGKLHWTFSRVFVLNDTKKSLSHWEETLYQQCPSNDKFIASDGLWWPLWWRSWNPKFYLCFFSYLAIAAMYWLIFVFIFGTACQIYCYGRYCVRRSVSPQVPENPSGPLVDNFIVLPCVAFGVACVKLLPGVDRWNSLDDPRVIGPCHCEVWGWPRH